MTPLKIDNISKYFGKKQVLHDVSFSLEPGQIFGLIGLNGAGKTTLIKIILGLLKANKGDVSIFDKGSTTLSTRKQFAYLPEKFHPSAFLKGSEFLSLTLSYYNKPYDKKKAAAVVDGLDLDSNVLPLKMTKYSKGMGQKIGLASAFLTEAPLLILDEPMSGLDPSARIHLKKSLKDYAAQGKTIFFSSHILSDIDEICDNIAIIHDQEIIYTGTPANFKKEQKTKQLEDAFLKAIDVS